MKKHFLLFLSVILITAVKAQQVSTSSKGFHFAGGINLGLPVGDFNDTHSLGIGLELQPEYSASGIVAIYGSVGYTNFFAKDLGVLNIKNLGLIPILAGAKVYFNPQFFIGAKAGVGILTGGGDGSGFDYQPQFGFDGRSYEVNFSYNGVSKNGITLSSLFLSVLYKFK